MANLVVAKPPGALSFNGETRDFDVDAAGRYAPRHWVDAAVWFQIRTRLGSIRSAPDLGNGVRNLKYIDRVKTPKIVQDRVLSSLSKLLARGLIRIKRIVVDLSHRGRILYQVDYVNLVTQEPNVTPQVAA